MKELFDIETTKSPRLQWIEEHGFLTHYCDHCTDAEDAWMCIIPEDCDKGKGIGDIMAESCRLYDERYGVGYGKTKDEAILDLCRKKNIKPWNWNSLAPA